MSRRRIALFATTAATVLAGVLFNVLPADAATNPCGGGSSVASSKAKAGSTVIAELIVYRLSSSRYCGVFYHRGPTYGVKMPTMLGGGGPNGKGILDSGNFAKYAGPATINKPAGSGHYFLGEITYKGHVYTTGVAY